MNTAIGVVRTYEKMRVGKKNFESGMEEALIKEIKSGLSGWYRYISCYRTINIGWVIRKERTLILRYRVDCTAQPETAALVGIAHRHIRVYSGVRSYVATWVTHEHTR